MKPYRHSRNSAKRWGGHETDYQDIHDFMDSSKSHLADARHRALLHHSFGCFLVEKVFGDYIIKPDGTIVKATYITNSDGKKVQVRDIAEQHIIEDLGWIPSVTDYFKHMKKVGWFSIPRFLLQKIIRKDIDNGQGVRSYESRV